MDDVNGADDASTIELSPVDLVLLGARMYGLIQRGATLREMLSVFADLGAIDHDHYFHAVWGVLDGRGLADRFK